MIELPRPRQVATAVVVALAVLVVCEAAAIGFLVLRSVDQGNTLAAQGRAAIQQNVDARFADCQNGEQVRAALREEVESTPEKLLYKLLPSLDTPIGRHLVAEQRKKKLKAYAPRDCKAFALASVPPAVRGAYHAP